MQGMNFTKALDLIATTDRQILELKETSSKLQLSLAAIAELENGASIAVRITCPPLSEKDESADMCVDSIVNFEKLAELVKSEIEETAKACYLKLTTFGKGEEMTETETPAPELEIPEAPAAGPELETPEDPKTIAPRQKVNRQEIADLYFKQGKSAKQIAQQTGLGESTVFKYLHEIKAEKEKAAKELVRR